MTVTSSLDEQRCLICVISEQLCEVLTERIVLQSGEREAVSQASKQLYYDLHTLVVEERPDDDVILRRVLQSENLSTVRTASLDLANNAQEASKLIAEANTASDLAGRVRARLLSCGLKLALSASK